MFGTIYIVENENDVNTPEEGALQFFLKNEISGDQTVQTIWAKNSDGLSARGHSIMVGEAASIGFNFNI